MTADRRALLEKTYLFQHLDNPELLDQIAASMEEAWYAESQAIVKEGDAGDYLYVLAEGRARVKVGAFDIARIEPGGCFGEMALFGASPRAATVTALTRCRVLRMSRRELQWAIIKAPRMAGNLMHVLSLRLRHLNKRLVESPWIPPFQRLPTMEISENPEDMLRAIPIFRDFNDLPHLARTMQGSTFPADTTIFAKGDKGDRLYILVRGIVKIHIDDMELARMGPGAHFGEMSLFDAEPRSASVTTLRECYCMTLGQEQIYEAINQAPAVASSMIQTLCDRVRRMSANLVSAYARPQETDIKWPNPYAEGPAQPL